MTDHQTTEVPPEGRGSRLDAWLAKEQPELSRARWQQLIKEGHVLVNHQPAKPNTSLKPGDVIDFTIPPPDITELLPEDIPLDVLFEDQHIIAINKAPGMVVHPAPGHASGTLVNALLHHCKDLGGIGGEIRPGIVHRLDMDTSGVILAAKTETALTNLQRQFKQRETKKIYEGIVVGIPNPSSGTIASPIGRHPTQRKKMQSDSRTGRPAVSHYETITAFKDAAHLRIRIETGRTHQIRVHLASIGHPILGDTVYGKSKKSNAPRHMLHAQSITFTHPETNELTTLTAPLPGDMLDCLEKLAEP